MPIQSTVIAIAVKSYWSYCDICSQSVQQELPKPLLVAPAPPDACFTSYNNGAPHVAVPPLTEEDFRSYLTVKGWQFETVHGKALAVCPTCREKK